MIIDYNKIKQFLNDGILEYQEKSSVSFSCIDDLACTECPLRDYVDDKYICDRLTHDVDYINVIKYMNELKQTDPEIFL